MSTMLDVDINSYQHFEKVYVDIYLYQNFVCCDNFMSTV